MATRRSENRATYSSAALARVAKGSLCAGCGGCALVAPDKVSMAMEAPGFLRPRQSTALTDGEERDIAAICPGLGQAVSADGRTDDPMWGPYLTMRTGHATDDALRFSASSGGALSAILIHLLERGWVDAVLHTGADPDLPIGTMPCVSLTAEDVVAGAGSRYAPSAPLEGLARHLTDDRRFAFVGKPCDVAALRALLARTPEMAARVPVLISFFCGGVPSQAGAERLLDHLGVTLEECASFRYRGHGWPGAATAIRFDGSVQSMSYHASWGEVLSKHVQHRCKICADGAGAAADIVCADAWESDEKGYPVFEERDGTSLIVARTALGEAIVSDAINNDVLVTQPFDATALAKIQTGQAFRRKSLLARLSGLALLGRPIPRYRGLHLREMAWRNDTKVNLRNFLGMIRRVIQGRVI